MDIHLQTNRYTDTHRYIHIDRQRLTQIDTHRNTDIHMHTDMHRQTHTYAHINIHREAHIDTHSYTQRHKNTDRYINMQKHIGRNTKTHIIISPVMKNSSHEVVISLTN